MKKTGLVIVMMLCVSVSQKVQAQLAIAQIIQEGIKKVIRAVDLKIQRLQNKTIWLQNAQKTLENEMSKLKLTEISHWVEKQRKLYDDYFQELWKVKAALTMYSRVKALIEGQVQLVHEYQSAWALFQQDKLLTPKELERIKEVYAGILQESSRNLEGLFLVINSFQTQMSDGGRMAIINEVSSQLEENFLDLKKFNQQAKMISLQRAYEQGEIGYVKKLYGL
jgi:hypothetical protein